LSYDNWEIIASDRINQETFGAPDAPKTPRRRGRRWEKSLGKDLENENDWEISISRNMESSRAVIFGHR